MIVRRLWGAGAAGLVLGWAAFAAGAQQPDAEPPRAGDAPAETQQPIPLIPDLRGGTRSGSRSDSEGEATWLWGETAVLRGLDKVTAETRDFEAPVGQDVQFFALTLSVKRCAKRPPEEPPETIVGMEIYDRQTDGEGNEVEPERIFAGWMFGSSPALNPLEHPVYDVWVLDCETASDSAS